jgi:hypothetical protein
MFSQAIFDEIKRNIGIDNRNNGDNDDDNDDSNYSNDNKKNYLRIENNKKKNKEKKIFQNIETIIYNYGKNDNSLYRQRLEKLPDKFIDFAFLSHIESINIIKKEKLDILLDLQVHTLGNRYIRHFYILLCLFKASSVWFTYACRK